MYKYGILWVQQRKVVVLVKKITITVDDTTLANLEVLRYYYPYSNNSALIRKAIDRLEESIRLTGGYDDAVRKYRENHPELFGGS